MNFLPIALKSANPLCSTGVAMIYGNQRYKFYGGKRGVSILRAFVIQGTSWPPSAFFFGQLSFSAFPLHSIHNRATLQNEGPNASGVQCAMTSAETYNPLLRGLNQNMIYQGIAGKFLDERERDLP